MKGSNREAWTLNIQINCKQQLVQEIKAVLAKPTKKILNLVKHRFTAVQNCSLQPLLVRVSLASFIMMEMKKKNLQRGFPPRRVMLHPARQISGAWKNSNNLKHEKLINLVLRLFTAVQKCPPLGSGVKMF